MRSLGVIVKERLGADGNVVRLVVDRVHPGRLPQHSPMPAIVYTVVTDIPINSVDGASGLNFGRVQLDCYSNDYDQAQEVADAAQDVLKGIVEHGLSSLQDSRRDLYEDDEAQELCRVSMDFTFWRN